MDSICKDFRRADNSYYDPYIDLSMSILTMALQTFILTAADIVDSRGTLAREPHKKTNLTPPGIPKVACFKFASQQLAATGRGCQVGEAFGRTT